MCECEIPCAQGGLCCLLPIRVAFAPIHPFGVVLERMALLLWSGGPWRALGTGYTTVFQTFTNWTARTTGATGGSRDADVRGQGLR